MAPSHARTIYQLKPKGSDCFVVWHWGLNTSESGSQSIATTRGVPDGPHTASRLLPLFPLFMRNFTVFCDCQWSGLKAKKNIHTHTHIASFEASARFVLLWKKNKITRPGNNKKRRPNPFFHSNSNSWNSRGTEWNQSLNEESWIRHRYHFAKYQQSWDD